MKAMKKIFAITLALVMVISMVACGKTEPTTPPTDVPPADTTPVVPEIDWSTRDVKSEVKLVLMDFYGDNFLMYEEMPAEFIEGMFGITSDMYTEGFGAMSMMSAHVDKMLMFKTDAPADVMAKLNEYRDMLLADTFQYPNNMPKIAASAVHDFENGWVGFFLMGGYNDEYAEVEDTSVAVEYYTDVTKQGIDKIAQYFVDGIVPEMAEEEAEDVEGTLESAVIEVVEGELLDVPTDELVDGVLDGGADIEVDAEAEVDVTESDAAEGDAT